MGPCLTENAIEARLAGRLDDADLERQDQHLAECRMCREWVAVLAASSDGGGYKGFGNRLLTPGARLGRYELQHELGRGGMGVVMQAWDPELGRSVAIKVLHDRYVHTAGRRLVREARALAQLDHPNVVTVHDVGVVDDHVFIAMELIEGTTLRRWLQTPRSQEQILSAFVAAGRGLHAAHSAGIVHRDFKPDNVLVGDGGRIKVTDFGLAASQDGPRESSPSIETVDDDSDPSRSVLTATGELVGTPRYMAPEQYEARSVDARTDQFSFCVALFEALAKTRPFVGDSFAKLSRNVVAGRVGDVSGLPRRVRASVLRGLDVEPNRRWPDMASLVAALDKELPSARGRRRVAVAMSLVTVAAVAGAYRLGRTPAAMCTASSMEIGRLQQRAAAESFVGERVSVAFLRQSLDAWADSWDQARLDACEATHIRHEQTLETLEQRVRCLDRAKAQFEQTLLVAQTERGAEDAIGAAQGLPQPASCAHPQTRIDTAAAQWRSDVRRGEALVDRARVLLLARRDEEAEPLLWAAAAVAERADSHRLRGQAGEGLGRVARRRASYRQAEQLLRMALASSLRVQDDATALRGSLQLASTLTSLHDLSAAELLAEQAEAQIHAHPDLVSDRERVDLLVLRQRLARATGDLKASADYAQRAKALAERGGDELLRAEALHGVGVEYSHHHRLAEAAETIANACVDYRRLLGPRHRRALHCSVNWAGVQVKRGRLDEAEAALHDVLSVVPDGDAKRTNALQQLARIYDARGEHEQSVAKLDQAIEGARGALGATHPTIGSIRNDRATAYFYLGRWEDSIREFEEVVRIKETAYGPEHPSVAGSLQNLSNVLDKTRRYDEAVAALERAKRISLATRGDHAKHAEVLHSLGMVAKHARRLDDARRYFREAYDHHRVRSEQGDPGTAFMALALAEVLVYQTDPGDPQFEEGRRLLGEAEVDLTGKVRPQVLARAALLQSQVAEQSGDRVAAQGHVRRAIGLTEGVPGPEGEAMRGDVSAWARNVGVR